MAQRLEVRMPVLSDTMETGEIIEWIVEPGATVRQGQPLASVATDKVDMELESPYEGVLTELLAAPGETVAVGGAVAVIETEQDELLGGVDFGAGRAAGGIVPAAPPARRRAKEHGVDLADVPPTGHRGQVTPDDVERYVAERTAAGTSPASASAGDRRLRLRRATAQRMRQSAQIPQFTLHRRVDLERAARHRAGRSWTTEMARALAGALWRHPQLNAVWDEERQEPTPLAQVRIGVAVATADGLVAVAVDVPDGAAPDAADARVRDAVARGQRGELRPDDTAGVSATVSNLGAFGVDRFDARLVPPQASILSVGRIAETPTVVDGWIRPRLSVELGLTVDHRVADGADAARLLDRVAERLEG